MHKNKIRRTLSETMSLYYLEGALSDVLDRLSHIQKKYSHQYDCIKMESLPGYGDEKDMYFFGERLETDEEFQVRLKYEKETKASHKEQEKALYQKLKKKYG